MGVVDGEGVGAEVLRLGLCSVMPVGGSPEMGMCMWAPGCRVEDGVQGGHPLRALTPSFTPWPSSPAGLTTLFSALT